MLTEQELQTKHDNYWNLACDHVEELRGLTAELLLLLENEQASNIPLINEKLQEIKNEVSDSIIDLTN